jgi:glutaminyl-peptide cyclotransferase
VILIVQAIAFIVLLGGTPHANKYQSVSVLQDAPHATKGAFDGKVAYGFLIRQTQFGPRAPGLAGHDRCATYLQNELKKYAEVVLPQEFPFTIPDGKLVKMTNLIASFNTKSTNRLLISAHWDTRLWADKDPDKKNWTKPISGANDGASGVAIILELARQLKNVPPSVGVDLVLFDGEDLGKSGHPESFSIGSKYFAANKPAGFSPRFGINIDMVGDRNLSIYREQNSEQMAPDAQNLVFSRARELGITQFMDSAGEEITDDHLPLNDAGIPTIDLIDLQYPDESNRYWHTLADTADKCSAESLAAVGTLLLSIIYSH